MKKADRAPCIKNYVATGGVLAGKAGWLAASPGLHRPLSKVLIGRLVGRERGVGAPVEPVGATRQQPHAAIAVPRSHSAHGREQGRQLWNNCNHSEINCQFAH
jgi:hypothetical protein